MRPIPVLVLLLTQTLFGIAQQPPKTKFPTNFQKWSARGDGVLIESAALDLNKDMVTVIAFGRADFTLPLELFTTADQEKILKHFYVADAPPEPPSVKAPAKASLADWHSPAGGLMVRGAIVGRKDQLIQVADEKGKIFRVPYRFFAEAEKELVRSAITKLEGKPFTGGEVATNPPGVRPNPPTGKFPMTPTTPGNGEPKGESRTWTMRGGVRTWQGRFVEIRQGALYIKTPDGKNVMVPYELLEEADKQYADTIAKGGKVGEAPKGTLVVSSRDARFVAGLNGQAKYLLDGRTLHTLGADGKPSGVKQTLAAEYSVLRERGEYWVGAARKELHLLDKKTFQPKAKHELWKYQQIRDVTLDPTRKVAVVSVEHVLDAVRKNSAERQRIVLVDEESGKAREVGEVYGEWVRMHPSGKYLLAGFHDTYKSGPDREIAPNGQILPRINTEHIDTLIRNNVNGFQVTLDEEFKNAGTNGQGLVLTADGSRVAYLSFTGYPTLSYQVSAFDAVDFSKKPVTFAMKDRADCKQVVFNAAGTLLASPGKTGVVLFDARSGEELPGRLTADADLTEAIIHEIAFSADGKGLTVIASRAGSPRFVKTLPLRGL